MFIAMLVGGSRDDPLVAPFFLGVMVMGSIVNLLALLIMSSSFYKGKRGNHYCIANVAMIGTLTTFALLGSVFVAPALTNTALTFLGLWLMEKQFELPWHGIGYIVPMFLSFVALFFASLWLSTHPGFLVAMVSPAETGSR
eukprot:gnl/MRDRNA2_/MRDRNA2_24923_c0_seq1.p2 gnl/MRDRNA2_/MRDRNA2_24923_c0~~gnl/MRDRNA2_/MRDRNA2_24923_c0_seq1.p2  ORF type:complete len:141 (+),score=17.62 gnl/MRDRNA2_/MRDRNA2_24923_c0_seq1:3-425(+)